MNLNVLSNCKLKICGGNAETTFRYSGKQLENPQKIRTLLNKCLNTHGSIDTTQFKIFITTHSTISNKHLISEANSVINNLWAKTQSESSNIKLNSSAIFYSLISSRICNRCAARWVKHTPKVAKQEERCTQHLQQETKTNPLRK